MKEIFCDVDGVLLDFAKAACTACGRPDYIVTQWDFYKDWGLTSSQFWKLIGHKKDFWWTLPEYPWARDLLNLLRETAPLKILTHPWRDSRSWAGKYDMLTAMGVKHNEIIMTGAPKEDFIASADVLLIDDNNDHVDYWREHGGSAILFPQLWNRNFDKASIPFSYVKRKLEEMNGKAPDSAGRRQRTPF